MLVDPAGYVSLDRWMLNRIMKLCFLVPWRHLHSYIGVEIELVTTYLRSGKELEKGKNMYCLLGLGVNSC
jgi:hypothetical protein